MYLYIVTCHKGLTQSHVFSSMPVESSYINLVSIVYNLVRQMSIHFFIFFNHFYCYIKLFIYMYCYMMYILHTQVLHFAMCKSYIYHTQNLHISLCKNCIRRNTKKNLLSRIITIVEPYANIKHNHTQNLHTNYMYI